MKGHVAPLERTMARGNGGFVLLISIFFCYGLALPLVVSADEPPPLTDEEKMRLIEEKFSSPYSEEMIYRTDRLLVTATGSPKPVHQAPSVATVITAEDIERIGATTLDEVLETVPGLHVSPSNKGMLYTVYSIRGIHPSLNPQVLLLVNGLPITIGLTGGHPPQFRMPVANIVQVEVIRGPGSALHGADAFAGTINVITKDSEDINGTSTGFRAGSFDVYEAWLQHGKTYDGWDVAVSMDARTSNGDSSRIIDADLQSGLDKALGTSASLAPGPLETGYNFVDTRLALAKGNWTLRMWGSIQDDVGALDGMTQVLSSESDLSLAQYLGDLTYHNTALVRDTDVNLRFSFLYVNQDSLLQLFPPGTTLPIGADGNIDFNNPKILTTFPDGVYGEPIPIDYQNAVDFTAAYKGFSQNRWLLGTGFKYLEEKTDEYKNFGPGVLDGTQPVQDGAMTHVSDENIYLEDQLRKVWYALLQDEYAFARHWELVGGVRYDHYSDFGGTINPRLALVWETSHELTSKLLYGRAFRPPSFNELYIQNNPANLGNPDLEPETLESYELAFDYQPRADLRTILNLFYYEVKDLIELVQDSGQTTLTTQNTKDQKGRGLEFEVDWRVTETFDLKGNFAYQRSKDAATGKVTPDAPETQFYVNAHWQFWPRWSIDGQYFWIGNRHRAEDDTRPDIEDYDTVNLTLRRKGIAKNWDVAFAVRNLFDTDIREPSQPVIPNDYPMEGRSVYGELRCHF